MGPVTGIVLGTSWLLRKSQAFSMLCPALIETRANCKKDGSGGCVLLPIHLMSYWLTLSLPSLPLARTHSVVESLLTVEMVL